MVKMFCFDCGIKFDGGVDDLYKTGDGHMTIPFCDKCSHNLNKKSTAQNG